MKPQYAMLCAYWARMGAGTRLRVLTSRGCCCYATYTSSCSSSARQKEYRAPSIYSLTIMAFSRRRKFLAPSKQAG